jgi:hypothetical protein
LLLFLFLNPDLSPFGTLPIGDEKRDSGEAAHLTKANLQSSKHQDIKTGEKSIETKKKRKRKRKVKSLTPNAIIKRIKFGETGISCIVDSFGQDGPEVFSEDTVIYINHDPGELKPPSSFESRQFSRVPLCITLSTNFFE